MTSRNEAWGHRRIGIPGGSDRPPHFRFFRDRKPAIHVNENREHRQRDQGGPLEQETNHDRQETGVLRVPDPLIRPRRRELSLTLSTPKYAPGRGDEPEAATDQCVANDVEWAEMRVPRPSNQVVP
jgi:hypothetical protein